MSLMHTFILRRICVNFMALSLVFVDYFKVVTFFFRISNFFSLSITGDLISRNVHLVHKNWYRINFTSYKPFWGVY
jgi:hypothetical protein